MEEQKKLLELANKIGYDNSTCEDFEKMNGEEDYLIWMCLLQKWLREEKKIVLTIIFFRQNTVLNGYEFLYHGSIKKYDTENVIQKDYFTRGKMYTTYELALEAGLKQSLEVEQ